MKFRRPLDSVLQTEVDSGLALLDPNTNTYFLLNKTGAVVWAKLEETVSLEEICAEVARRFNVTEERCKGDIIALLGTMTQKGFVVSVDEGSA